MDTDADPTTGTVVAIPEGFETVPLHIAALDENWLLQWTPTLPQIVGALAMARAKNLLAPTALKRYRDALRRAERERNIALGLAVHKLRSEYGYKPTMTELHAVARDRDARLIDAEDAVDTAWLELEYAKDFAKAVERDVSLLQSIAKSMIGGQP